jgi:glucose/arabinose dehydrogenase
MPTMRSIAVGIAAVICGVALAACSEMAQLPFTAGVGPTPTIPEPNPTLVPTIDIAPAKGWPDGQKPVAAQGTNVSAFAKDLEHPRWIYVLPNGDVLVAESAAPPKPESAGGGIKGWFKSRALKKAGSAVPSANRITLLRDADGDGVPEVRTTFLEGLNSPFGMVLVGNDFYVANCDAIVRFPYRAGETRISVAGTTVTELPAGINHHWTKNLIANRDGSKLYVTVGSNSNVAERGMEAEQGRAAIWEVDPKSGEKRLFATGLRNPNGLAWERETGALWTVVNERDELGSDLVPDYLTSVKQGAFYGWPYSYFGQYVDKRAQPARPDLVEKAVVPDYALGTHVAPLGLAASDGASLPPPFQKGMFIGQHGSWNRKPRSGYNVIFVPFSGGQPSGNPVEVLNGFVGQKGEAYGRPVGVAIDKRGALLVADDVGNMVWRVTAAGPSASVAGAVPGDR